MNDQIERVTLDWTIVDSAHLVATLDNIGALKLSHRVNHMEAIIRIVPQGTTAGQGTPDGILAIVTENNKLLKEIKVTDQEMTALLTKIDTTTNHTADNVKTIADVDQKISDEIDAFLAAAPAGTVLTDAQVAQLQTIADRAQATSDAGDAQVAVLQAIAAKGAPVVPTPAPTPAIP